MSESPDVFQDLVAVGAEVDAMVAGLDVAQWRLPTPAPGWTIAHQIAHLTATFRLAGLAGSAPEQFVAVMARLDDDFTNNVANALDEYLAESTDTMLRAWRAQRDFAIGSLAAVPEGRTVPWLVNPLPAKVLAAAGLMELFAHGQDIADALGVRRDRTRGLRHLVEFAVRAWSFGYLARGLPVPPVDFRFELTAPSGEVWEFGPAGADQRISGTAEDFCLLVSRRRHRDDLAVGATGADADRWLDLAQAYRGPAGEGRTAGQFGSHRVA